ncbi:MAG TPA: VWA domain-containing protein [Terriglobales bacterium]|nr:VWA domain-containing protein [Terriglobales bacterium]
MCRQFAVLAILLFSLLTSSLAQGPPGLSKPMDLPATPGAKASSVPDYTSGAKRAEEEAKLQFRSSKILIRVPVVVADKNGSYVHGLKKDAFHVLEEGQEQNILQCEEVWANEGPLEFPNQPVGQFTNTIPGETRAAIVVLIDTINSPALGGAEVRKQLLKFLADNLSSKQPLGLMILGPKGLQVVYDVKSDPKQLLQSLKSAIGDSSAASAASDPKHANDENLNSLLSDFLTKGQPDSNQLSENRAIEQTVRAFHQIAWSVAGIGGKKALVWVADGFPFRLDSPSSLPGGSLSMPYERALAELQDSYVSVYPVSSVLFSQADSGNANKRSRLEHSSPEMLQRFAAMTGGRAYLESKNLASLSKELTGDNSSYYVLSYELNTRDNKPGWRQLAVKMTDPNLVASTRSGFLVTNSVFDPELSRTSELDLAAGAPLDSSDLPIVMAWQNLTSGHAGKRAEFALAVPASGVTLGDKNRNHFQLDVWAIAEKNGSQVKKLNQVVQSTLSPDQLSVVQTHGVGYRNALQLAPGDYTVHFVVRDNMSGRVGSLSVPLKVE